MRLRSLCIFLMMAAAAMPTAGQQFARRLTPEQVFARMMSGEQVVFVDARSIFTGPMIAEAPPPNPAPPDAA